MKKLSKRSISLIKLFLNDNDFKYISLNKHDVRILFEIYEKSTAKFLEYENEIDLLKKERGE